jgi:hypothetical protein
MGFRDETRKIKIMQLMLPNLQTMFLAILYYDCFTTFPSMAIMAWNIDVAPPLQIVQMRKTCILQLDYKCTVY